MERDEQNRVPELEAEIAALGERLERLEREVSSLWQANGAVNAEQGSQVELKEGSVHPAMAEPLPHVANVAPRFAIPVSARERESLESRVGSQVFNRIGVVAILIGASWALKLAIDNQLIGPMGRVVIGLLAGVGLVLWSERFRRKGFPVFSYSLKAVGSGVLYLSLWASLQLYHLLPAGVVLVAMLLVTAWNAWMAWAQDAELLAVYALGGGFSTPLLIATGGNHAVFLFSYLFVLDVATIALVAAKPWTRLLAGALPATVAFYIGWYSSFYSADQFGMASFFTLLFFLLFSLLPLIRSLTASAILTVWVPLGAGAFGSLAFYSVLQDSGRHDWLPWGAVAFAAFYLVLMRLQVRVKPHATTEAIHLTLAVVFLTIAIPLKASGHWITVGWIGEGMALFWVATSRVKEAAGSVRFALRGLAIVALALGYFGALIMPVLKAVPTVAVWNERFATSLFCIAAMAVVVWLCMRAESDRERLQPIAAAVMVCGNVLALVAVYREIWAYWMNGVSLQGYAERVMLAGFSFSAFMMFYGAAMLAVGFWNRNAFVRWQALVLLLITIVKVFLYDMRMLSQGYRVLSFVGLGALLMAVSFVYQKDLLGLRAGAAERSE